MTAPTAALLVYTIRGEREYINTANPGLAGLNCDLDDSIHLALQRGNGPFIPLHHGTGIVFAKADYDNDTPQAVTKTLVDPWVFRTKEGALAFCAIVRNENEPDPICRGNIAVFDASALTTFPAPRMLQVGEHEIRKPTCAWNDTVGSYVLTWEEGDMTLQGHSRRLREVYDVMPADNATMLRIDELRNVARDAAQDIEHAVAGNILALSNAEGDTLETRFGELKHVGVNPIILEMQAGHEPEPMELPNAICQYNDGSSRKAPVEWNQNQLNAIDWTTPGTHTIDGTIRIRDFPFPFLDEFISDPCICEFNGRYFLSCTQSNTVTFRIADTIEGLRNAKPLDVFRMEGGMNGEANLWAQEMHIIRGVPYVFTTVGLAGWSSVQCQVLRCLGDPADPSAWEAPRPVVRADGTPLYDDAGIGLDMTYFEVDGVHYVMWSGRTFLDKTPGKEVAHPADIRIATIDPAAPWHLTSEPQLVIRPTYGWDRCQSEVDEGPYLLRHGDDLFVTISGASTALPDLYCVGLLRAKRGTNLLDPSAWRLLPYPVLTKESVPGEFGPGHNMFITDPETGDDLFVYHAVPHDTDGRAIGRRMGIRRVHWAADGLPRLDMTPELEIDPTLTRVNMAVTIR